MSYKEKLMTKDLYESRDVDQAIGHIVEYPKPQVKHKEGKPDLNSWVVEFPELEDDSFTAPYDGLEVSLETYWNEIFEHTEHTYEWNNGILEAKPMAILAQVRSYVWFLKLLSDYLFGNAIAEMTLLETPFKFNIPGQTKVRIPDMAVVLNSNPVPLGSHGRTYKGIFDLCVESLSDSKPGDVERDTMVKWGEYAQGGVTEYYILDERHPPHRKSETAFYRRSPSGVYQLIPPVNGVIQSTVLPGFQFRVDDLEDRPTPLEMLDDPVYQGFTSPFLRAERERAERELQAEQERAERELQAEQKRAEQELQAEQERAERAELELEEEKKLRQAQMDQFIAYANAQGISLPDDLINPS